MKADHRLLYWISKCMKKKTLQNHCMSTFTGSRLIGCEVGIFSSREFSPLSRTSTPFIEEGLD